MSEADFKRPQRMSTGLRSFFVGIALLGLYILMVNLARGTGKDWVECLEALALMMGVAGLVLTFRGLLIGIVRSIRSRRLGAIGIQFATLIAFGWACYAGVAWREGKAVPGDQLVVLLGKHRNDPAMQSAMRTLGPEFTEWENVDLGPNVKLHDPLCCVSWAGHNLMMKFNHANILVACEFIGNVHLRPYDGPMPMGLAAGDSQQQLLDKLGPPDAKAAGSHPDAVDWLYKARHLLVEWDRERLAKVCTLLSGP